MAAIETRGVEKAKAQLTRIAARVEGATGDAVDDVLEQLQRQARRMLSLGWHSPGTPTGSAPGSPPWRISGRLSRAITVVKARPTGAGKWSGKVGPTRVVYARIQEIGGWAGRRHRSYLPPRPYMKPAVRLVKPTVRHAFVVRYHRAIREALR